MSTIALIARFDDYLKDLGPVAIVIREHLIPVEGADGVFFPATYAAAEDKKVFPGGYNIDGDPEGENVALIDSVGAQANRIEPLFAKAPYANLIPQIVITAGTKEVNLLHAGHRAGDAIVRSTALHPKVQDAFKAVLAGNMEPLAKIAPTSLVFGVWDSRDTQAKVPRLIASTIRAYNVRELTRSAQFNPAVDYVGQGLLEEPADKSVSDVYAGRGFVHVPATGSHGGVIAKGGIRRDATLSLAALRLIQAGADAERTLILQRYVLGLALVALTHPPTGYLRQGSNLSLDPGKTREFVVVHSDGKREAISLGHKEALAFALEAATAFVVGQDASVAFENERAKKDVAPDQKKSRKSNKGDKKPKDAAPVPGAL